VLCAPSSVYYKPAGQRAQRVTYLAVDNDATKKTEVVSFVEQTPSDSSDLGPETHARTAYPLRKKPVAAIYALASHSDNTDLGAALDICVVYADGSVESVSGDLKDKRWDADAAQAVALTEGATSQPLGDVEYATVTDVEKARRGLLKSRDDALAAILGSALTTDLADLNVPLLVLATASQGDRHIRIFALPSRSKHLLTTTHPGLRHLLTHRLPTSSTAAASSEPAAFSLHASTGKLHQLLDGKLTTFDFSGTVPTVLSCLTSRAQPYTSFVRVSPTLLMASDSSICGLYDAKYTALQGQLLLTSESVDSSPGKRKRIDGPPAALDFVAFFSDLGLAVAISENNLVGLQVNTSAPAYKKSKSGDSLLINSLAKGFSETEETTAEQEAALTAWKEKVDTFLVSGDINALEKFIAAELDITGVAPPKHRSNKSKKHDRNYQSVNTEHRIESDGVEIASGDQSTGAQSSRKAPQEWDLRNAALLAQKTDPRKAQYMLSNMFAWRSELSPDQSPITVLFFAPNIFKWLAFTGYLTAEAVSRALSSTSLSSAQVKPGDILVALNELDPEMHIMHLLLSLPVHIPIEDVCIALRTLIRSLDDPKPNLIAKLISSGGLDTSALPPALATEDEAGALEAAEADLNYTLAQLENGLGVRSTSLRTVFHRLNAFPTATIISALRTHLQQQHLIFFIQLLRVELADGGWTTPYQDETISPRVHDLRDGERVADNSLLIISRLLAAGIDAIGLQGWMVPPSTDKDNVIAVLAAETSAALEGAYEAAELGIYLSDFERFATAVRDQVRDEKKDARLAGKVDAVKRPGFEDVGALLQDEAAADPIMPLGGKVAKTDKMLVRSGGREQKKSKSLLGKEISMKVGKYSFERIRV